MKAAKLSSAMSATQGAVVLKSDHNPIDPVEKLRNAPRCAAKTKSTGKRCCALLSKAQLFADCTALVVTRRAVLHIQTLSTASELLRWRK
ncbi:hypothetical protein RC74_11425 [Falsihalocynthiibacter arcticus]|uniref:Uncharacterized protein n=1 Tax=Falsihalocynthiibacter arcticus TaxID=1579316 RepID=A0A126V1Q1_9RHOB|nr:hypothetical protein RC74_11425 [Falsihalocynthiibacter arcticus]